MTGAFSIDWMNLAILVGAGLVVVSALTSIVAFRLGAPLLLVFLGVGLAAGVDGPGGIVFDDARTAYFIASVALAVVLFDSGFGTPLSTFRVAAGPALMLATVGVLATTAGVGLAARVVTGLGWPESFLLGAIVSSTDAAAVFFLLRAGGITLRERVRSTLEVESGSNDPMAIFLTLGLVTVIAARQQPGPLDVAQFFVEQVGFGLGVGALGGWALVQAVNRVPLEASLMPIFVLGAALVIFAVAAVLDGSGFLAVYLAGLIAGNLRIRGQAGIERFQAGLTWLCQIVMFVTLGLLATPSEFPAAVLPALLLAAVLGLVARPIAVYFCLLPFRFSRNETAFVSWVGLRGAVSIALAILPILYALPEHQTIFNVVFLLVIVSLTVQGWSIGAAARWLGLVVPPRLGAVDRTALELPGDAAYELLVYTVHPASPAGEGQRLPRWARPSLVLREGRAMTSYAAGQPRPGDRLYILARTDLEPQLDRLFAAPAALTASERGFFGTFALDPADRVADVAELYGLPLPSGGGQMTLAELVSRSIEGALDIGDRVPWGAAELVVREIDGDAPTSLGLDVDPPPASRRRLPLFQSPTEVARGIRGLVARLRYRLWRRRDQRRVARARKSDDPG